MSAEDPARAAEQQGAPLAWIDRAMLAASAAVPACVAAAHLGSSGDVAHDEGAARVAGWVGAGAWGGPDALFGAAFQLLPLGTRAFRASLASAAAAGIYGAMVFVISRALLARAGATTRLLPVLAAAAAIAAGAGVASQIEASSPGGSCLGAALALGPIALLAARPNGADSARHMQAAPIALASLLSGAALACEPMMGLAAVLGAAAILLVEGRRPTRRPTAVAIAGSFAGASPIAWSLARARFGAIDAGGSFEVWRPGALEPARADLAAVLHEQVGWVAMALAAAGLALGLSAPRTRSTAAGLAAVLASGAAATWLGAPCGPESFGAPLLASIATTYALSALGIHRIVRAVREAEIPFARASAAMIVVLALTFPAIAVDESGLLLERREGSARGAVDAALASSLPPAAIVFVEDAALVLHLAGLRASGALSGDVAVVPVSRLGGRMALRELARDAALAPFFRDMALTGAPSEWALTELAARRPVLLAFPATWDRRLARHLTAEGFLDRFDASPRGASERRAAVQRFEPVRVAVARELDERPEPALTALVAALLRARALEAGALGERDLAGAASDDLRAFAPSDPVAAGGGLAGLKPIAP